MASPLPVPIAPVFSHGGSGTAGTGNGAGRVIAIFRAAGLNWPCMFLKVTGAMTVDTQMNPGPLDGAGEPDANSWISINQQVFVGAGEGIPVALPPTMPYVRTLISGYGAGALTSCVPCIPLPSGDMVSAQYVSLRSGGNQ